MVPWVNISPKQVSAVSSGKTLRSRLSLSYDWLIVRIFGRKFESNEAKPVVVSFSFFGSVCILNS